MKIKLRILIADSNRFHALLMDREIHKRFSSCVTATFRTDREALRELMQSRYDVAIIECAIAFDKGGNLFKLVQKERESLPILLTGVPGTIQPEIDWSKNGRVAFVVKEGTFHVQVPQLIDHVLKEGIFHLDGLSLKPRLSARREADMINIATRTLAHEINNPLMTILGMTELLLSKYSRRDSEVTTKIEVIEESARRIESVLEHLGELVSPRLKTSAVGSMIDTSEAETPVESKI
jgi:signal transduction histidine kinase